MADERFELTESERHSAFWGRLMKHFEDRLSLLRAQNDANKDEMETAMQRGKIAEIKRILELDNPIISETD
jgi:hypothetical protein